MYTYCNFIFTMISKISLVTFPELFISDLSDNAKFQVLTSAARRFKVIGFLVIMAHTVSVVTFFSPSSFISLFVCLFVRFVKA